MSQSTELRRVQKAEKGSLLTVGARCGYEVTKRNGPMPDEFTSWHSAVTCPDCLSGPPAAFTVS